MAPTLINHQPPVSPPLEALDKAKAKQIRKFTSEYQSLKTRYSKAIARQFARYDDGTATRARTCTFNANAAWTCERLKYLKGELASLGASIPS